MKVKELIEILKNVDEDLDVIIQEDGEGNYYSPLDGYFEGEYVINNTWSCEILDEEDEEQINCIVLVPVNQKVSKYEKSNQFNSSFNCDVIHINSVVLYMILTMEKLYLKNIHHHTLSIIHKI